MDLNPKTKLLLTLFGIGTFLIPSSLWFLTSKFLPFQTNLPPKIQTQSEVGSVSGITNKNEISSSELIKILDSPSLVLFDLSNEQKYKESHIKVALNINLEQFREIIKEDPLIINELRRSQIVVYCTNNCSETFLEELASLNLTNVKVFNSFFEWRNLGYPLEP